MEKEEQSSIKKQNTREECDCIRRDLPCWNCYDNGFETVNPELTQVGDRVVADWSEGNGNYDEIEGIVVEIRDDIILVDVDHDDECSGGDNIRFGKHDCAPEWIIGISEVSAADIDNTENDTESDGVGSTK